jgi:hypothetical protein
MKRPESSLADRSPDRNVFYAIVVIGTTAMLMVGFETLGRTEVGAEYNALISWSEILVEIAVVYVSLISLSRSWR